MCAHAKLAFVAFDLFELDRNKFSQQEELDTE